jgi:hypothetical protein
MNQAMIPRFARDDNSRGGKRQSDEPKMAG